MKNPLLLAVLFAVMLLVTNTKLPFVLLKSIDLLAAGATPIILISLGIFLARELPKVAYTHVFGLIGLKLFGRALSDGEGDYCYCHSYFMLFIGVYTSYIDDIVRLSLEQYNQYLYVKKI